MLVSRIWIAGPWSEVNRFMIKTALLAGIGLALFSASADAREVSLRCTMKPYVFSSNDPDGDRRVNAMQDAGGAVRFYIVDAATQKIWPVFGGKKGDMCEDLDLCSVEFSQSAIIRRSGEKTGEFGEQTLKIDRISGALSDTLQRYDASGNWISTLAMNGQCTPESKAAPQF